MAASLDTFNGDSKKDVDVAEVPSPTASVVDDYDSKAAKVAYRKADKRILLFYSIVYLFMRINVSNITNTAIINIDEGDGIKKQLGNLTSSQWAWVISVFYYPYLFAEPASTLLLKQFTPSVWMSRIMITWGAISMCQAATKNYAGIIAASVRIILDMHLDEKLLTMIKGSLRQTPHCVSLFSMHAGSIPAILFGIYAFFLLPNYPETSKWLTDPERKIILDNLPKTQPSSKARTWDVEQVKALFKNPTTITFTLIWVCHAIGGWGVSTVLPTVIYELGLTGSAITQLLTMPTYGFGCFCLVVFGWLIQRRIFQPWLTAMCLEVITCVCYILLIVIRNPIAKYCLLSIAISCSICIYPILWPERIRAAHGTTTAGLAIGLTNAAAQFSGIVGPQVFQSRFGPTYKVSYSASIGLLVGAILSIAASWYLVRKQDRREKAREEDAYGQAQQSGA
ncbi:hypothetical protein PRZ48_008270 [Zasmidium cellare]|uniref:Uncharacterized protein n=1 Tax=Zasmidium cellare TaxID=395010 RepID=A0ABR0EFC5_ZASCE|nr:hypothetical protein PRZ48_008270 [Zasmidium cellare]